MTRRSLSPRTPAYAAVLAVLPLVSVGTGDDHAERNHYKPNEIHGCDDMSKGGETEGGTVSYIPCNCACDTPSLQNLLDNAAARGVREIQIGPGTLSITSPIQLASNLILTLHPLTLLSSTVPGGGSDMGKAAIVAMAGGRGGTNFTLVAAAKIGDTTLSTAQHVPAGTTCMGDANTVQCFEVLSSTGAGPYVTAISTPVALAQPSGTLVAPFSQVHDVTINGNGALLTGSGACGLELTHVNRVVVRNLRIAGTWSAKAASLDVGSRDSGFEDLDVDGGKTPGQLGVSWEGCDRCWGTRVKAYNSGPGIQALWLDHVTGMRLNDCEARAAGSYGLQWTSSPQSGSVVSGGTFGPNASSGIIVEGSSGIKIENVTVRDHPGYGIYLWSDVDDIALNQVSALDNWNGGLYVLGGNVHVSNYFSKWTASAGVYQLYGVKVAGPSQVSITNWTDASAYYGALYLSASATVRVNGFDWAPGALSWIGALADTGSTGASVTLANGFIRLGAIPYTTGVRTNTASTVNLHGVQMTGSPAKSVGAFSTGVASTWLWGAGTDFSSARTPYDSIDALAMQTKVSTVPGHP